MTSLAWNKIKSTIWLGFGVICLSTLFVIWIWQGVKRDVVEKTVEAVEQEEIRTVKIEEVKFNANLGSFYSEVPALNLAKRNVEIGNHEPEFRGTKFITENKNAWTLQLMHVNEEDIIRAYLAKRDDRDQFHYFRLQQENVPTQYVLTYGVFNDVKSAAQQIEKKDFTLPESIKMLPERFVNYADKVNDLGSDELAQGSQLRTVMLTRTALPRVAVLAPQNQVASQMSGGTTTVIERKDELGNVKSSNTENTQVKTPKDETKKTTGTQAPSSIADHLKPAEQIIDPF